MNLAKVEQTLKKKATAFEKPRFKRVSNAFQTSFKHVSNAFQTLYVLAMHKRV
jgi:hypothetical protein